MIDSLIVTHQNPDLDAIGATWILKRFDKQRFGLAQSAFVPAGEEIDDKQLEELDAKGAEVVHVDTGGGEFDHHDDFEAQGSAMLLVYEDLVKKYPELKSDEALIKMVEFITKTDHFESYFWPEPNHDRYLFMLEQILNGFKLGGHGDDNKLMELGLTCLDGVYSIAKINLEAKTEIEEKKVTFDTKWGEGLGILSSNDLVMKMGQKMGYNIVVRKDPELQSLRIKAAPKPEIDLTPIYERIKKADAVGSWYFHPGKHMLINGSRKHLGQKPSPLSLEETIEIIKNIE